MCPCAVERAVPCAPGIVNSECVSDTHLAAGGGRVPRPWRTRVTPAPSRQALARSPPASRAAAPREAGEDAATCEPSEHSYLFTGVILMAVINTLKRLQTLHSL